MKRSIAIEIISFALILLFVYASTSKIIDFQRFRIEIGKSPILTAYSAWYAVLVPLIEILLSLMLFSKRLRLAGLYGSFSIMIMFTTYIFIILHYSEYIPCSCGGVLQNMTWNQHMIFNFFFIFLAAFAIIIYPQSDTVKVSGDENKTGEAENL
jgi:hypothetical protein